jgi:hypothetical protein
MVTGLSPTRGPTSGGTTVTLTGRGFTGAVHVAFGAVAASSFKVVSDSEIIAVSPAQGTGLHNIYVSTPQGTSAAVAADEFTYGQAPVVTGVSPSTGPTSGGTMVTITGTGFSWLSDVAFGAVTASSFASVSPTEITAVSPAQGPGVHNIYVTTRGGTSAAVEADKFTYGQVS